MKVEVIQRPAGPGVLAGALCAFSTQSVAGPSKKRQFLSSYHEGYAWPDGR